MMILSWVLSPRHSKLSILNQEFEKEYDVYELASPTPYAHSVTVINFDNGSNSITKFIWHTATVPH